MKKAVVFMLTLIVLLAAFCGCNKRNVDDGETVPEQEKEYNIIGEYRCDNQTFRNFTSDNAADYISAINFYEGGICMFHVFYGGGVADLIGVYLVEGDSIRVTLDLEYTIVDTYMDYEYIFYIENDDNLIIDRHCYAVDADDTFIKISSEPAPLNDPEYIVLGKFTYAGENLADISPECVPYIKFYKGWKCVIGVGLSEEERTYTGSSGGLYIMEDTVWYKYYYEDGCIHLTDLRCFPLWMEVDHHPLLDIVQEHYIFTVQDWEHLVIDQGFNNVKAGDTFTFVREK